MEGDDLVFMKAWKFLTVCIRYSSIEILFSQTQRKKNMFAGFSSCAGRSLVSEAYNLGGAPGVNLVELK